MEPVYCPNGHPNRPGTRICFICRELIVQTAAVAPEPAKPASPPPSSSPPADGAAIESAAPDQKLTSANSRRLWLWLLALLLLGVLCIAAVWAIFIPVTRTTTVSEVPTTVSESVPVVDAEPSLTPEPTQTSAPTETPAPAPTNTAVVESSSPTAVATITPLSTIVGIVITPTFAFGRDANFIQNGDFSDDWANGWTREPRGGTGRIDVAPAPDDPDKAVVQLENSGAGMLRLAQRIVLTFPAEGLVFRGQLGLSGTTGDDAESRSMLILRYEDANGDPLGASVWLDGSGESTELWGTPPLPPLGPTVSTRFVTDEWRTVEINLGREFAEELPDIDPVDVRQITIILATLGSDGCAIGCGSLLEAAGLSLTAEAP